MLAAADFNADDLTATAMERSVIATEAAWVVRCSQDRTCHSRYR